jgi:cytoskeletal protein CcmA (bactofilin family)/anti-sigma factor RsiW
VSCFDELTIAIYADAELPQERLHEVEAHLMSCRACRERVVQLREEAEILAGALHERRRRAVVVENEAPARGVALGIGPTLLAAAVVTTAVGWLLETAAPLTSRWLGPFSLRGAYDMAFDVIFLLRDQAPGAVAFATAVAAMASASALLTFFLSALLRRVPSAGSFGVALALALASLPGESSAHFGFHTHDDFELAAGETHDGTLFVSAETADINGIVEGDLLVFSRSLTLRGEVRGNVLAVTRTYEQPGKVEGSVHVAAIRTHLAGDVDGNFYAFSEDLTVSHDAKIGRDAAVAADRGVLEGKIARDLYAAGDRIELRGEVERHLRGYSNRLALLGQARVRGDLDARLPEGHELEISPEARIDGEITTSVLELDPHGRFGGWTEPRHYGILVLHIAAGFMVAMLLRALLPRIFETRITTTGAFFWSLGTGFLIMVAAPFGLLVLCLTVVGIPLGVIGAAFYLISLYVGCLLVSFLVGATLLDAGDNWTSFGMALLAGLAVLVVLTHLPMVGMLFRILIVMVGVGLVGERCRAAWRHRGAVFEAT